MMSLARARLIQELKEIAEYSGFSCSQPEEETLQVDALIFGDVGAAYETGIFRVKLYFSEKYPLTPPLVKFDSEMFHPNIGKNGYIELDILKEEQWLPSYSLTSVLTSIRSLLSEPCPSWPHPANPEATDLFLENRCQYNAKVKAITKETFCEDGKRGTAGAGGDTGTVLEETGLMKLELLDENESRVEGHNASSIRPEGCVNEQQREFSTDEARNQVEKAKTKPNVCSFQ